MDMHGSRALGVSQQQAWDALNDPEVLKTCIAGCDKLEASGDNQFTAGLAVKIGPVSAKFTGKITLSDVNPPNSYTISFDGQGGAAGFGKGQSKVSLLPADTGCELQYTVNAQVGGKVAQLGQRLIEGAAKSMAEDFFKRFDAEMQRRYPAPGATAAATQASAEAPGKTGPTVPIWVWVAAAALVALGAWWLRR
jgi:hypothetical protein